MDIVFQSPILARKNRLRTFECVLCYRERILVHIPSHVHFSQIHFPCNTYPLTPRHPPKNWSPEHRLGPTQKQTSGSSAPHSPPGGASDGHQREACGPLRVHGQALSTPISRRSRPELGEKGNGTIWVCRLLGGGGGDQGLE